MKLGEKGFTLIELIVAVAIIALIGSATATATLQVLRVTGRNNEHMTAVRQVHNIGYWISRDAQMAQSVATDNLTEPDFLVLNWTEWNYADDPIYHSVTYFFEDLIDLAGGNPIPETEWGGTFGGSSLDFGEVVRQTADGGYIIAGATDSYGAGLRDVYLVKTDASGNKEWGKTFGGGGWDFAYSVEPTTDGGYIIAGTTGSYGAGSYDVYLIKTDASGNKEWEKTFGGSGWDNAYSVGQTTDGGYIIAGTTGSYGAGWDDVYLIKADASGNKEWEKTFGGSSWDNAYSVEPTTDGGYIIAGATSSYGVGSYDVYLIKTDASGNKEWEKTIGGGGWDNAYSVRQTTDGGYIIAGTTDSYGAGLEDVYLIKTDASGNKEWEKTSGGSSSDFAYSVKPTTDGGYIIAGATSSCGAGSYDVYLIKTDASGNKEWEKAIGGSSSDFAYSVEQTTDGGYIIAGATDSHGAGGGDVYLVKVSPLINIPVGKLKRSHWSSAGTNEQTLVAEYIYFNPDDPDNTTKASYQDSVLNVQLTSLFEEAIETREYMINLRPNF